MTINSGGQLLVEQVTILARRTPVIVAGTLLLTAILVYVLNTWFPLVFLIYWAGAVTGLSLLRLWINTHYNHEPTDVNNALTRARILTLHSGISGVLWGVLGYFFVDVTHPIASVLIVMVLTGMVASAVASLSVVLPAFLAFMLPAFLPASYRFATLGNDAFITIAVLIVIFMLASLYFAVDNYKSTRRSILLGFENLDLVENLSQEKERADEARILAETANLAKSKFLAAASHDLRQPMHALRLFAAELLEQTQNSEYQETVTNIGLSIEALESLFDALLDISKLDAGTLSVEKQHFRLQPLLERLKNEYSGRASEKSLRLEAAPTDAVAYSDPTLLERILRNLLSNALKYTNNGSVTVSTAIDANELMVSVKDTGLGIVASAHEKIFEEFTQLHNSERDRRKGLGLGLSIVRRIARLLDHPLRLVSAPGKGSMFSVSLPQGDAGKITETGQVIAPDEPLHDCKSLFVLVIEDEQTVREGLTRILKHWQCVVLATASLAEALQALSEYEYAPEVILSDYRLRDHATGLEAIAAIRDFYDDSIPALIMTGDTDPERLKEAHASAIPLMHKPFEPRQLKAFLANINQEVRKKQEDILGRDAV